MKYIADIHLVWERNILEIL